jgi:superfamily II DNA/RNA helicase
VRAETTEALEALGITDPFPIQALTLPLTISGNDIIGQARTGTGKTLAFAIPILERIDVTTQRGRGAPPQALVVVPTRELAIQVASDIDAAGKVLEVRVLTVYGGRSYEPQVDALTKGVDVVVGTPGRLLDLSRQRHLDLSAVQVLVLDEADEMLDLGFLPDVEKIVAQVPRNRQTMLFSATMPGPVVALARQYMSRPTHVRAEEPDEGRTVPTTQQHVFRSHSLDKPEMLARILQADGRGLTIVFCRTKRTCDKVADDLAGRGFAAAAVHGDLGQGQREQALRAFRSGKIDVLVATDVAARGIDVSGVTHVVNYQCPEDEKVYLHRIGRTGRAGESGVAITLVDWDDLPRWTLINDALALPFPEPPETYSTSEHLYEALDIPRRAAGMLPRADRTRAGLAAEEIEDLGETGRSRGRRPKPAAAEEETEPSERPARRARNRARRRTRGGAPVDAPAEASAETTQASPVVSIADAGGDAAAAGEGAPRRRRRRGSRGRGSNSGQEPSSNAAD